MAHVVTHAVVDSGAFIRNAPLKDLAGCVYTVREVVAEIRDKATLQRLQVLPYDIVFRDPSAECIKTVTDFTKLTGDYPSLSATDIRVMALTYQLEKEHVGTSHIKTVPNRKIEFATTTRSLEKPTDIAGFYLDLSNANKTCTEMSNAKECAAAAGGETFGSSHAAGDHSSVIAAGDGSDVVGVKDALVDCSDCACAVTGDNDVSVEKVNGAPERDSDNGREGGNAIVGSDKRQSSDGEEEQEDEEEQGQEEEEEVEENDDEDDDGGGDDDDEGWITPGNLKQVQADMQRQHGGSVNAEPVAVGCVTTDFAMQNVLIQMGLNVVSCDGLIIKKARSYVLRCAACFKITTNMTKQFCYHCGNKMLQKVSATVNEDGSISYHLSRRRPVTTRGLKFSLPMPKGGKHAVNPRLTEDQPTPQQRASKMAQRRAMDVFADDYVAQASPFAAHDVVSRAARLGIRPGSNPEEHYWNRRNPNEVRRHGRRK